MAVLTSSATEALSQVPKPASAQDVIQLYASADHHLCPKVYHSTRAFSAGQGNPYKLSIVPRSRVKGQEHWSISATGVCHIGPDHAAVFIPSGKFHTVSTLMVNSGLCAPEVPALQASV
ncbi:hypothetical protein ABBQ38_004001 [Trebouxia sp. C0009 RCD-2024]